MHLSLFLESDPSDRAGKEGGASPGDECDEELAFACSLCQRQCCLSGAVCCRVWEIPCSSLADPTRGDR